MRREVEVYVNVNDYGQAISYQRLDLFEEESINITNSIKEVKDIAKVFTDYSQQFNVPASKPNNKLFKHYYNFDIQGGYDARVKREALIKINGEDYRTGFVSLSSVSMKNQQPFSYKVVFYGKTVNLKRLFGDDELSILGGFSGAYLDQFDHTYTSAFAQNAFENGYNLSSGNLVNNTGTTAGDLCYPFVSGRSHYYYDSQHNNAPVTNTDTPSRNVQTHGSSSKGLDLIDLKPAIRLYHIILGIENKYNIEFTKNGTNDFFSTSNNEFYQLYLWLHREKGNLNEQVEEEEESVALDSYAFVNTSPASNPDPRSNSNKSLVSSVTQPLNVRTHIYYEYTVQITPSGGGLYTIEMLDTESGNIVAPTVNSTDLSGDGVAVTRTFILQRPLTLLFDQTFTPVLKVKTRGGITSFTIGSLVIRKYTKEYINTSTNPAFPNYVETSSTYYDANYTNTGTFTISGGIQIARNMPKMKVIDFLTSIFKMFNLTAFYDDRRVLANGTVNADYDKIKVMTIDDFYSEGVDYTIDKYLYTDKHSVDKANIYSEINFDYSDASTFAIIKSNEITGDEFGNESLNNSSDDISSPLAFDGGKYDVKLGFEHMMFERMTNQSGTQQPTAIQWGWMVSEDENPIVAKPLLFYCHKHDISSTPLELTDGTDIDQYIRPANTLTVSAGTNLQTIHFGEEVDEYFGLPNSESLFSNYYFNYIVPIYNERARLSKFKALLPTNIINKLKLNDKLIISNKKYKINKIKMNLNTGKADLELINEV